MDNPFTYGPVVTGEAFTDRAVELAELKADLKSGQDIALISPRRYGKTSLVWRAMEELRNEGMLIAYTDLGRRDSKQQLADALTHAIYGGLFAPFERAMRRATAAFQHLAVRPKVTIGLDGAPTFEFAASERSKDLDQTLEQLLEIPARVAKDRKRPVAIVLDEFQKVMDIDPQLPATLRSVFQFQATVSHVYLGSRQHLMTKVFIDENAALFRSTKPLPLGPIRPDLFAAFIRERFSSTGRAIEPEAIDAVLEITEGRPADTQELCHFLWAICEAESIAADAATVGRALDRLLDAEDVRYQYLWDSVSRHQRLTLTALASDNDHVYSDAYRQRHRLGTAASVQKSITRLIDLELIESSRQGGLVIADVFFREWIRRPPIEPRLNVGSLNQQF